MTTVAAGIAGIRPIGARRLVVAAAAMVLAASTASGCVTAQRAAQAHDVLELSLRVPAGTPARVETFNGGIEVRAAEGPGIAATVTRRGQGGDSAAAEADRDAIEVVLEEIDGVAVLRAVYTVDPNSIPVGSGAAVTLHVPAATPLELTTSNGSIRVEGTTGGLQARTSNAPVELRGLACMASVESSNGPVSVTSTEPVVLDLATSNGGITFTGSLAPGDSSFETSNGPVRLRLPTDAAFTIDASTSGTSPTTDFDFVGTIGDGSMQGVVGTSNRAAAGASIVVRTSNGPVAVTSR